MTITAREQAVERLLRHYPDLSDPLTSGNGYGNGGVLKMPHEPACQIHRSHPPRCTCSFGSVVELERLLRLMRSDRHRAMLSLYDTAGEPLRERVSVRACWWHVNAWYLTVRWVMLEPALQRGRRKQPVRLQVDSVGAPLPIRVPRREPGVREDIAARGVGWLAVEWDDDRAGGGPRLPGDVARREQEVAA